MDENQSPQQENQETDTEQTSEPNVYEPQPRIQPPNPETPAPKKSHKLALVIILLVLFLIAGGAAAYLMSQEEESTPAETSQTNQEATQQTEEPAEEAETVEEAELVLDETDYYTLTVPEGFERVDGRIFTFTGQPEETFSYLNIATSDYFEININPADSGLNADFVWTYTHSDGVFTLDKSDSTVCLPEDDEWCEFSGANDRLDSAIFAQPEAPINGQRVYFTFGNTSSQTVGNLSYVDQFLENIEF